MDHQEAERNSAVERYLQGEMQDEERDQFEAHYFSCVICAENVQAGFLFRENARIVLREPWEERRPWWRLLVPAPAFASAIAAVGFAAVVLFQNAVTIPELRAPLALRPALILDGTTRDSLPQLEQGVPLHFRMAVDGAPAAGQLQVDLANDSGRVLRSGKLAAPGANEALEVYFPGSMEPGRYVIVVRSVAPRAELARNAFRIVKETGNR
jgi:hypothetical protein